MISVIFVCLGNICRSPMAEAVFSRMAEERGVAHSLRIGSFATSDCEEGNPVYPPASRVLKENGYDFSHRAEKLTLYDLKNADYVLVMDEINREDVMRITGGGYGDKIRKLGSFLPEPMDIEDPWYTRDFERTFREIYASCKAFMDFLLSERAEAFAYDNRH